MESPIFTMVICLNIVQGDFILLFLEKGENPFGNYVKIQIYYQNARLVLFTFFMVSMLLVIN